MLKVSEIQIGHTSDLCITDVRPNIRFSLESDRDGEELDHAILSCGDWNVKTQDQLNNTYTGVMEPFTQYDIQILAVGISGETARSSKSFCTGRLNTPWTAKWITDRMYTFPQKESPVPMVFLKRFAVEKALKRAWVNITALGIYELEINGQKVGLDYFAPGLTSYQHQIQYQTYDITSQLTANNVMMATVAGGWAAGSFTYSRKSHISCDRQALLCELHLIYADGKEEIIGTNESWLVTEDGPVKMAEWYDGETYDAGFDWSEAKWRNASITAPKGDPRILAQYGESVRACETMMPISCAAAPSGEIIYDFGQNFAGVIAIHIRNAKKGQKLQFRHAEVLLDQELFVKSLRTAKATVTYICRDGEQDYSPRFTYMGFRYVGVSGIDPKEIDISAKVIHSDCKEIGKFECSNPLINRLNENIRWGGRSNFVDIPTDCPQRDEREGWTGDAAVFASTACFNFDMSRFYDKWLLDVKAEQGKGGGIPMVIPRQGDIWPPMATACWGDCCVLVPWAEYMARGDKSLLERQYPVIKKFLRAAERWSRFLSITPSGRYVWRWPFQFGDWCAPNENIYQWMAKGKWIGTAYFANSCGIAAEIADILNEPGDAIYYRNLREKIVKAYRKVFTDGKGKLKKEFQTAYVLPLYFGMTGDTETSAMAHNLSRILEENGNKLATGFPGTPYLLFALSDNGYLDLAYKVLLQEECPGWMYEVKAGGTTIWERWDALRPDGTVNIGDLTSGKEDSKSDGGMVSFNHYANGAVGDWLYRRIAGIEPLSGGYREFRIAPMPGGGINSARASIMTPYGKIVSDWRIDGDLFLIDICVPVSSKCTLFLPNGKQKLLQSGNYSFKCHYQAGGVCYEKTSL